MQGGIAQGIRKRAILLACLFLSFAAIAQAEEIRQAVWAGRFYPAEREELLRTIESLCRQLSPPEHELPDSSRLKALIMPHA